jgi:glycosyltransferase involved in cell wall biosynthesis
VNPIKLVVCTDGISPFATGGMQKHSRLLIEQLAQNDDLSITVLHPHKEVVFNNNRNREIAIDGIDPGKNYLLECFRYSQRIAIQLNKLESDVIYSQGLCVWANVDQFKSRLIMNPHGLEPYQAIGWKNRLLAIPFKAVFNYLFGKAACVVSLGGKLTDILKRNVPEQARIHVIANGVNLPARQPLRNFENERIEVLFFARFASNKGIHILFEAIDKLEQQGLAEYFEFVLAGKGPLYEYYLQKNKYNNVKLPGFIKDEDLEELYTNTDLFVLPTLFEGMPTVVLEAMSYSLPVIVSDVGATSELVDRFNGFLIQKSSAPALVEALLKFRGLSGSDKLKMGEASYTKVKQRFTWQRVADDHVALFHKLVKDKEPVV